ALESRPPRISDPVDLYRLQASQGSPRLRLPGPQATAQVLRAVSESGIKDEKLSTINGGRVGSDRFANSDYPAGMSSLAPGASRLIRANLVHRDDGRARSFRGVGG